MKKIFTLCFSLLILLNFTAVASAAPSFWYHTQYNLANVKKINITEIQNNSETKGNFTADKNIVDNVAAAIYAGAAKENILITESLAKQSEQTDTASLKSKQYPVELELKITVNHLGYTKKIIAAHYEEKTELIKIKENEKDKNTRNIEIPVQHKVYIPEETQYTAYLEIIYKLYDPKTNTLVFNSKDYRSRTQTFHTEGMLERSTKDLFKNIKKSK